MSNPFWKTYLSPNPNMQDVQLKAFNHLFQPGQLLDSLSNAGRHPCSAALGLILHGVVLGSLLEHRQKSEDRYSVLLRSRDCECDAPALLRQANKPQLGFGFFTEMSWIHLDFPKCCRQVQLRKNATNIKPDPQCAVDLPQGHLPLSATQQK